MEYVCFEHGKTDGGKELCVETPILTTTGWKTQGTLEVGDIIFDEQGNPTKVTDVFPAIVPEKTYRIYLSDGTHIDASGDHRWATITSKDRDKITKHRKSKIYHHDWVKWQWIRTKSGKVLSKEKFDKLKSLYAKGFSVNKIVETIHLRATTVRKCLSLDKYEDTFESILEIPKGRVKTTKDLFETQKDKFGHDNHTIPNTKPLNFEEKNLPIPPYTYGCWLADGYKTSGRIAQDSKDWEELASYIEEEGFKCGNYNKRNYNFAVYGLYKHLRESGVLNSKKVLPEYFRCSVEQRKALLAGLLDCDGSYSGDGGQAYFYNTNIEIVKLVQFLVLSLGMIPRTFLNPNYHNGKRGLDIYRVVFSPNCQVFKLRRKQQQIKLNGHSFIQRFHRYIREVVEIESKPMRCISVDSPNHLYLCGNQLLPTSNTKCSAEWTRYMATKHPGCRIALVGATASDIHKTMLRGRFGPVQRLPSVGYANA